MSARIGLIVPCDLTLDSEYWEFVPAGVTVHIARTAYVDGGLTLDFVRGVSRLEDVAFATRSLSKIEPEVIAFACTSGSFIEGLAGERRLRQTMLASGARAAVTTSGSLLFALASLGLRRVALGTPYATEIAERLPIFLREAGYEPVSLVNLELPDVIGEVPDDEVTHLAELAYRTEAEALFLACTGVPTLGLLARLEGRYGIPVLSANQVTMWAALRVAGALSGLPRTLAGQSLFERMLEAAAPAT